MTERAPGTWRIGRIAGADLLVRPSLLIMVGLLFVVFSDGLGGSTASPWLVAGALVVSVYLSIIVHELAHLASARANGHPVRSITLHMLGGETAIEGESRRPWEEFWTAAVGPIASALLGYVLLGISGFFDGTTQTVLSYLGQLNIVLAIFNMLPAWPMDGGRALRAVVWAATGRESTGLMVAGWVSRVAAVGLVLLAALLFFQNAVSQLTLLAAFLIAWFLWVGAGAALQHGRRMRRVEPLRALDLAEPGDAAGLPAIAADAEGERLLRAMASHPAESYALVDEDGEARGVLHRASVESAYRRGGRHA